MSDLKEKIARQLCADGGSSGFCSCVGESLGCKVGRGELFNGSNCAASSDQLKLSGYVETADRILAIPEIAERLRCDFCGAPRTIGACSKFCDNDE